MLPVEASRNQEALSISELCHPPRMNCPLAEARLLETGVAATVWLLQPPSCLLALARKFGVQALFGGTAATGKESLACFKVGESLAGASGGFCVDTCGGI